MTTITGTVEHGMIRLPGTVGWSDGSKVRVELLEPAKPPPRHFASADLIGCVDGDGLAATNERVRKVMGRLALKPAID